MFVLSLINTTAFAPERVAQAVDEVHPAELVHGEEVAGAEPHVALLEHVLDDLALGGALVDVAVEAARGVILDDLADELAGLAGQAEHAEAVLVAHHVARLVDADEAHLHGGQFNGLSWPGKWPEFWPESRNSARDAI